jgi:hypothetical protein
LPLRSLRASPGERPEQAAATGPQEGHGVRRPGPGLLGYSVEQVVCAAPQWRRRRCAGMNRPRGPRRLGPFIKLVGPNPLGPFCSNQGPQRQKTYEAAAHESPRWVFTLCYGPHSIFFPRPRSLGMPTQNISSSTHHIESLNTCMKH